MILLWNMKGGGSQGRGEVDSVMYQNSTTESMFIPSLLADFSKQGEFLDSACLEADV